MTSGELISAYQPTPSELQEKNRKQGNRLTLRFIIGSTTTRDLPQPISKI